MNNLTHLIPTGEPGFDSGVNLVANGGGNSLADKPALSTSIASGSAVSELISRHPLLAVTAAGAIGLLAVMALRKRSPAGGAEKQLARTVRIIEKAKLKYGRSDIGARLATMVHTPEVYQLITQGLERLKTR